MILITIIHSNWAIPVAVIFFLQGARCTMRVTLSTVTSIVSHPVVEDGRSVMKSMEIPLHFDSGIWVDTSFPLANVWSDFSV